MRKQDKIIIWPVYFDSNKSREEGRRVATSQAVSSPRIPEIQEAAANLGLQPELVPDKGYPKTPWSEHGMLLVQKQGSKEQTIKRIARQLQKTRNEVPKQ